MTDLACFLNLHQRGDADSMVSLYSGRVSSLDGLLWHLVSAALTVTLAPPGIGGFW
jgi:hypothetical protein